MNVASLELCKELYELSGWKDTLLEHKSYDNGETLTLPYDDDSGKKYFCPAYDLGYLLRKLQATANREWSNGWKGYDITFFWDEIDKDWSARFKNTDADDDKFFGDKTGVYGFNRFEEVADIPEDAACKLAIELFKQELLS